MRRFGSLLNRLLRLKLAIFVFFRRFSMCALDDFLVRVYPRYVVVSAAIRVCPARLIDYPYCVSLRMMYSHLSMFIVKSKSLAHCSVMLIRFRRSCFWSASSMRSSA
jgi:hypothetical protein